MDSAIWRFATGSAMALPPTVAGGSAYAGDRDGHVYAEPTTPFTLADGVLYVSAGTAVLALGAPPEMAPSERRRR